MSAAVKPRKILAADDPRHGTTTGYGYGCRCDLCKAAKRESAAQYYLDHVAETRESGTRWRLDNPEKERERHVRWRLDNPDKVLEHHTRYNATESGKARTARDGANRAALKVERACCFDTSTLTALLQAQGGLCAYCLTEPATTVDHVQALSRGGWHCGANMAAVCERCNNRKGVRPLNVYLDVLIAEGVRDDNVIPYGLPCAAAGLRAAIALPGSTA